MVKIFLDDVRNPPDSTWLIARNSAECIKLLKKHEGKIKELSLDHDLGEFVGCSERTGKVPLQWLEQRVIQDQDYPLPKVIFIHSANPVGKQGMELILMSIKRIKEGL